MIFALSFSVGGEVPLKKESGGHNSRDELIARFNDYCEDLMDDSSGTVEPAFFGITEGVLLAEEAHERGYETESWVLDAGEAPHERDWLAREKVLDLTAYFKTEKAGKAALSWLVREYTFTKQPTLVAEKEQDWNATWKASFTGIEVHEGLRVLPPWHEEWEKIVKESGGTGAFHGKGDSVFAKTGIIAINPGAGFGTGTHETTQLCLKILSSLAKSMGSLKGLTVLDFGSGSGILGIAAALHGAKVYCVEIDPMANDNATENARMNGVEDRISITREIPAEIRGGKDGVGKVDVLIANILRPILLQFADEIKDCLKPKAELVLSGLIESDLAQVINEYQKGGSSFQIERLEKNEWRALWLRRT